MKKIQEKTNDNMNEGDTAPSFENHDKLNRENFARELTRLGSKFWAFEDEAYVLSVNGKYGSGKTQFLNMWKSMLESEEYGYDCIYINTWESDFNDEPFLEIVTKLCDLVGSDEETKRKEAGKLMGFGFTLLEQLSSISAEDLSNSLASDKDLIEKNGERLFNIYQYKRGAFDKIKEWFSEYFSQSGVKKPLFIFIDELDRVRPTYAIKFLETIKHFFSIKGVHFVIAIDKEQLEKSVKQVYGDIDFKNYYLRFITDEANIPKISQSDSSNLIEDLHDRIIIQPHERKETSFEFLDENHRVIKNYIKKISLIFDFSPRQIIRLYKSFARFYAVETAREDQGKYNGWLKITIFMLAFKISDKKHENLYHDLGELSPNARPSKIKNLIDGLHWHALEHGSSEREYFFLDVLSGLVSEYDEEMKTEICNEVRAIRSTSVDKMPDSSVIDILCSSLSRFPSAPRSPIASTIYKQIESTDISKL